MLGLPMIEIDIECGRGHANEEGFLECHTPFLYETDKALD